MCLEIYYTSTSICLMYENVVHPTVMHPTNQKQKQTPTNNNNNFKSNPAQSRAVHRPLKKSVENNNVSEGELP